MSLFNKLLGIWVVGKTVSTTTPLFMRLILGMAVITLLAVFCAVILAVLIAGAVWLSYTQLVAHGITTLAACAIIGLSLLALMLLALLMLQCYWRKAYRIVQRILYLQSPISGRISTITDAFMNGYRPKQ
jgi:uncharacterized membrane protein